MTVVEQPALPYASAAHTDVLWDRREEASFAGLVRIAVPIEGCEPAGLALAESFLAGRWLRPGALSPIVTITGVELELEDDRLVLMLTTDPPIDDRTFVGIRMARDLRAALRHARRHTPAR